jgi:hypothetical protein
MDEAAVARALKSGDLMGPAREPRQPGEPQPAAAGGGAPRRAGAWFASPRQRAGYLWLAALLVAWSLWRIWRG